MGTKETKKETSHTSWDFECYGDLRLMPNFKGVFQGLDDHSALTSFDTHLWPFVPFLYEKFRMEKEKRWALRAEKQRGLIPALPLTSSVTLGL